MDTALASGSAPDFLKLLAHDLRWKILTLLAHSDYNGQEFVRLLGQPQNLVSYHLRKLYEQRLVREHRSTADERSIYFRSHRNRMRSCARVVPSLSRRPRVHSLEFGRSRHRAGIS